MPADPVVTIFSQIGKTTLSKLGTMMLLITTLKIMSDVAYCTMEFAKSFSFLAQSCPTCGIQW